MGKQDDLITYVFDGRPHPLSSKLLGWMDTSSRFTDFVETYRDKIRKKIRVARGPERVLDLRSELEVAYCLLGDRRLDTAYEPYASAKGRAPDFAVTYRTNLVFNIEVTRLRAAEGEIEGNDLVRNEERILRTLLEKLGQMRPGMPNLLVMHTGEELARAIDLRALMQTLKIRAEKKDPSFYAEAPYTSPSDFYKDFNHLSAILPWADPVGVWVNKQARPKLPKKVLRLVSSLAAEA